MASKDGQKTGMYPSECYCNIYQSYVPFPDIGRRLNIGVVYLSHSV